MSGSISRYKKTNPYQDLFIYVILMNSVPYEGWYSLIGANCRNFSNNLFDFIDENIN